MSAYFEYNGKSSSDFHMTILNEISFPSPEADIEFVEVLGRDGELAINNQRLKGVSFSIPIRMKLPPDKTIEQVSTDISNWLKNDVGWHPLRFSGSPDYEYIALFHEQFNVTETLKTYGKTVLTFKLKPYKRMRQNAPITLTSGQTLVNPEKRSSKPLIAITGNGNITLKNNGADWLVLENVDGSIVIDSESMSVYKGVLPQFPKMKSHLSPLFPVFKSGDNTITWTGNVTKVEITPRWEVVT